MKVLRRYLLSSFLLIICLYAKAQTKPAGIQGEVYVENNILGADVSVSLLKERDSTVVFTLTTPKNGQYFFGKVTTGIYLVLVSKPGYRSFCTSPLNFSGQNIIVSPIHLKAPNISLKEVTITDRKRFIEVKADKTVLNIDKGILASGNSVLDVLATAPGVRINSEDEILFKGGQKALVLINEKPVYLSSQDLANQLHSMASGDVESIELIANPSSKYDAGGTGGVINIVLKKGKNIGLNGNVTSGLSYGNFFKYNFGANLNYRTKKLNVFGNLTYTKGTVDHTINVDRTINGSASNQSFDYHYYNTQTSSSPGYRFGTDYFIDSAHTIGFLVFGNHIHSFLDKNTQTDILDHQVRDSSLQTMSGLTRDITSINYNLNYNGNIGRSHQTLSADADYSIYKRYSSEYITSNFYDATKQAYRSPDNMRSIAPTQITILSARLDYVNPISSTEKIEAGVKTSFVKSDNSQDFSRLTNNVYLTDPFFSSLFTLKDDITYGYLNYTRRGKKIDYNVGLHLEHTSSMANSSATVGNDVNLNYIDLFPQVQVSYKYSNDGSRLSLFYNRRIDRPSYEDLNPIVAYQDKYDYRTGNAFLMPSYQNNIQFTHTYKAKYITSVYFLDVSNFYSFNYFSQNNITKVYTTTHINLNHMYTYGFTFSAPAEFTYWWNADLNVDASYQRFADNTQNLNRSTPDLIVRLNQNFIISKDFNANIRAFYESPTYYGITSTKSSYYAGIGLSKGMFGKQCTVTFNLEDVFNTHRDRYSSNFSNLNVIGYDKKETQVAKISLTYRFGKKTVKAARQHDAGNAAEKGRIGAI